MTDSHSPLYCVFDHWNPQDPRKIVITSSLVNDMKSDLTEAEFWYMMRQLTNFKRKHTMVRKKKLLYWDRDYAKVYVDNMLLLGKSKMDHSKCQICGKKIIHTYSTRKYCHICAKYIAHMQSRFSPETIKDTCSYIHTHGYKCYYTGISLDLKNSKSPYYCVLDHHIPHDSSKIVITFALLNEMKSDLTEDEFWYYVEQFDDYKRKHKKVRIKKPAYWFRLYPT